MLSERRIETGIAKAVLHFWDTRSGQAKKQQDAGRTDQGSRGAVTGGKQMDGFLLLVRHIIKDGGLSEDCIYTSTSLELPGYFRHASCCPRQSREQKGNLLFQMRTSRSFNWRHRFLVKSLLTATQDEGEQTVDRERRITSDLKSPVTGRRHVNRHSHRDDRPRKKIQRGAQRRHDILAPRGMKVVQAAPAAYRCRFPLRTQFGAKSMFVRFVLLLALVAVSQTVHVRAADGPAKDVPELQVLSNYIGTWDVAITSKDSPFKKGESSATWVLDGRFVQQTGVLQSADGSSVIKVTTLMTYDSERKVYRMWSFLSNGTTSEGSGKWDEKTRTMTSTSRKDGTTTTTTAKFSDSGIEEWLFITTNQNNEVVGRFGGTNTRRKQ